MKDFTKLELEAKNELESEKYPYEALKDIKKRQTELREQMKVLNQQQKAYRQTDTFRVAGGLMDSAGWEKNRVKEELTLLKIKRYLLELWKMPLKRYKKELEKLANRQSFANDDYALFRVLELGKAFTQITGIDTKMHPSFIWEHLNYHLEKHPEDANKTMKPIPKPTPLPTPKGKNGKK